MWINGVELSLSLIASEKQVLSGAARKKMFVSNGIERTHRVGFYLFFT